jgi:hypothetical protein
VAEILNCEGFEDYEAKKLECDIELLKDGDEETVNAVGKQLLQTSKYTERFVSPLFSREASADVKAAAFESLKTNLTERIRETLERIQKVRTLPLASSSSCFTGCHFACCSPRPLSTHILPHRT